MTGADLGGSLGQDSWAGLGQSGRRGAPSEPSLANGEGVRKEHPPGQGGQCRGGGMGGTGERSGQGSWGARPQRRGSAYVFKQEGLL